jgi:hypothetical protein
LNDGLRDRNVITYRQEEIQMGSPCFGFASGTLTSASSAAAIEVKCGFKPKYVKVWIKDDSNGFITEWWEKMADATAIKHILAGDISAVTSNGITPSVASGVGFTIGTACQVNSLPFIWMAIG